ncbi:MAG: hypothetical protein CMJ65_03630 [Planctomycetaceae bacterium]|nr:hypothetical protein [Planctomycetaceae bacterium]
MLSRAIVIRIPLASSCLVLSLALLSVAADRPAVDFVDQVRPILQARCLKCHGPDKQEGGLRLDRRDSLVAGGDSGEPAIRPGKSSDSPLVHRVLGTDPATRMPPKGPGLTRSQLAVLKTWIDRGAVMPESSPRERHWAFQRLAPVAPPRIRDPGQAARVKNAVDAFVFDRLREARLAPSRSADRRVLIRRAALVVTGLPPGPGEIEAFLKDRQPGAWRRVIDRLLESPRYGERWAGHWLDLVRFAETTGYESNARISNAWHYRDYVIRALNEDRRYDRFVFEQLAGDTVGEDAATGFLVAGPRDTVKSPDLKLTRQQRQDELDEIITATGSAFLGLTIGCARCHSHKFDPIPQRDYYSVQAIFAGVRYGDRRIRGEENDRWQARLPESRARLDRLKRQRDLLQQQHRLRPAIDLQETSEKFPAVTTRMIRLEIHATNDGAAARLDDLEAWTPRDAGPARNVALAAAGAVADQSSYSLDNQSRLAENLIDGARKLNFFWRARLAGPSWVTIRFAGSRTIDRVVIKAMGGSVPVDYDIQVPDAGGWRTIAHSRDRMLHPADNRKAESIRLAGVAAAPTAAIRELMGRLAAVRQEVDRLSAGPQGFLGRFETPETTYRLKRGDPLQRLEPVLPGAPGLLGSLKLAAAADDRTRRVAFARRIAAANNPLAARVIVNRVWQHHFGTGLVDTPSDLGRNGSRPTHPGLLDWLAVDFIQNGWSLKHLHRRILLSATFQQSSRPRAPALAVDNQSRLLWRFPPRRLEAEVLRDSILAVSGKLNLRMYGPGFDFYDNPGNTFGDYVAKEEFTEAGWRRMIYGTRIRLQRPGVFGAFDCPDGGRMAPKRSRSTTPVQSLGLFNSRFVNRQAEFLAERVRGAVGEQIERQVEVMVEWALGRSADKDERSILSGLASRHGTAQVARVLLNSNEFVFLE